MGKISKILIIAFILIISGFFYNNCSAETENLTNNFTVDSIDNIGLHTFTVVAPNFNLDITVKEKSCILYLDNVSKGEMAETGPDTGVFSISNINISFGEHYLKANCSAPGVTPGQATRSWSFGTKKMVLIPSKCLQLNEIWYLGGGYTIKTDKKFSPGDIDMMITFQDEKKIGWEGKTFVYFPLSENEEVFTTKLQAVKTVNSKPCLQFSDTYINSKKIGTEVAPIMIPLWSIESWGKKTLIPGESFDLSGGFSIHVTSLNSKSDPRVATVVLTKNCIKLDEKTIIMGEYYSYGDILKVKVDSIFSGAVSDMVQFREATVKSPYDTAFLPFKTENWTCGEWSDCAGGEQTRTCADSNNCGTAVHKPDTEQTCGVVCSENWHCGDWIACTNGKQLRRCTDSNNCGTASQKPAVSQTCVCDESWSCSEWSSCANGKQSKNCIDLNNCGTVNNKPALKQNCSAEEQGQGTDEVQQIGERTGRGLTKETALIGEKEIMVQKNRGGISVITAGDASIKTNLNIVATSSEFYVNTTAGLKKIKYSPEEIKSKVKSKIDETGEMEIKEEKGKTYYSVFGTKKAKLFSLVPVTVNIEIKIDFESGEITNIKKSPWWSIFAKLAN